MEVAIIGGFPRAGTRQFTDILNAHPKVEIKGECFPKVLTLTAGLFKSADFKHAGRWGEDKYKEWRLRSALNAYAGLSKGSNSPYNFGKLDVVGFKSPRVEVVYEDIASLFHENEIKFFYCVRSCEENYLSENSTFGVSVEDYISSTVKSLESFFRMREDKRFSCTAISLDDFLLSPDRASYIENFLFGPLERVSLSKEEVLTFVESTKNINATVASGKVRRQKLTKEESLALNGNVELGLLAKKFEELARVRIL